MTGRHDDRSFIAFDARITHMDVDGNSYDQYITLFALSLKNGKFPVFGLERRTIGKILHNFLARYDINFEEHPKFSKSFVLYGKNQQRIRTMFTSKVREFFELNPSLSVFAAGPHLVMYRGSKQIEALVFDSEILFLNRIADILLGIEPKRRQITSKRASKNDVSSRKIPAPKTVRRPVTKKGNTQYW